MHAGAKSRDIDASDRGTTAYVWSSGHLLIFCILSCIAIFSLLAVAGVTWTSAGIIVQLIAIPVAVLVAQSGSAAKIKVVSGFTILALAHALLFVLRPGYALLFQDARNYFAGPADSAVTFWAQVLAATGFIFISLGFAFGRRSHGGLIRSPSVPELSVMADDRWRRLRPWLLTMGSIGIALWGVQISSFGWSNYWQVTFSGRSEAYWQFVESASGYVTAGPRFALGVTLLFLIKNIVEQRYRWAVAWALATAVLSIPLLSAGSRSGFLPVVFFFLLFLARWRPSVLSTRRLILLSPIIFIAGFVAPRLWRVDLTSNGSNILDSARAALDPVEFFNSFLGGLDTAMFDSFVLQIQGHEEGYVGYTLGATYLAGLLSFVPRSIWPSKPVSVDETLNAVLLPDYLERGTGIAYGFYSEPFLNFAAPGLVLVSLLLGFVLGRLTRWSEESPDLLATYWYALFASFTFVFMRGNLSFDLQRFFILAMPIIVALLASQLLSGRKEHAYTRAARSARK